MKITSLSLINHPILGTLELDFRDPEGNPYDTIILAGENGTGKTTLLKTIFYFFDHFGQVLASESNEKRSACFLLSDDELSIFNQQINFPKMNTNLPTINFSLDYSIRSNPSWSTCHYKTQDGMRQEIQTQVLRSIFGNNLFTWLYSDVETNFNPADIRSVTTESLDTGNFRSRVGLATQIAQLLIDVQAQDDAELSKWARSNVGATITADKVDQRMFRFRKAYSLMFPHIQYVGVSNVGQFKRVLFEQFGKLITLESLSTGEKQVVFRGTHLLRDKNSLTGALIIVDEPEVSLHPNWQKKILSFYKGLFRNEKGSQTSQLIVATHSPFIIHNEYSSSDRIIVLERNSSGQIVESKNPKYPNWTPSEAVKQAFKVDVTGDVPIIFLEGETDELYLRKTIEVFETQLNGEVHWIGRKSRNGVEFTGDTALNHSKNFFMANPHLLRSKIVLLYDSDTNVTPQNYGQLIVRKMPFNERNTLYKKGIENLLSLPTDFPDDEFYIIKEHRDGYGAPQRTSSLDKIKLCNWICNEVAREKQLVILENLKPILDEIVSCLALE